MLATWLALLVALYLALPRPVDPGLFAAGCAVGLGLCALGFLAADRARSAPPERTMTQRIGLGAGSLVAGALMGGALLALLRVLAGSEPNLRARFAERLDEPRWRPWALAFESSILEEIAFRLVVLSCVAWGVGRLSAPGSPWPFRVALVVSAVLFGLVHLPAWAAATALGGFLIAVVLLLNGIAAVLMGWIYWRWGLAHAILCHFGGDLVIQSLGPIVLA